jgi:hypothetical protein
VTSQGTRKYSVTLYAVNRNCHNAMYCTSMNTKVDKSDFRHSKGGHFGFYFYKSLKYITYIFVIGFLDPVHISLATKNTFIAVLEVEIS